VECLNVQQIFIDLLYVGNITIIFGKNIIDLTKATQLDLHVQQSPHPPPAITTFIPQKHKIQKDHQSNIVCTISCSECDDSYVRKTNR